MYFKFGFDYQNITYGWYKKSLYKLPYIKNNRSYSLKEIKPIIIGCTTVYNIQRNKLTINRLKQLTIKINKKVDDLLANDCPF